jgi:hypothetical protein
MSERIVSLQVLMYIDRTDESARGSLPQLTPWIAADITEPLQP